LSLANFSDIPLKYSVQLADTVTSPVKDTDGNSHPPLVNVLHSGTIPPHQTDEYVFSGQEAQNGLLHSVVVTTAAKPGTYQAKLVSRSTGILYQVELLAKETREMNNAGVHPFTLKEDSQSHIILFNHSKNDAKAGIFINSGPATVWASEIVLAPLETREVSINQLQKDQIPDDHGNRIPVTAREGVADWRTPDSGQVTGRLMVTSHDKAMARNFSCGTSYSVCGLSLATFSNYLAVGGDEQLYEADAYYCTVNPLDYCSHTGNQTNGTVYYAWSVGATNIIALSSPSQASVKSPMLTGVSAGTGYANVTASAGSCQTSGGGDPAVVKTPTYAIVQSDIQDNSYPNGNPIRLVTYIVYNQDGSVAASIPIGENYSVSGWNCTSGPNNGVQPSRQSSPRPATGRILLAVQANSRTLGVGITPHMVPPVAD
jgi:hypothetical protein